MGVTACGSGPRQIATLRARCLGVSDSSRPFVACGTRVWPGACDYRKTADASSGVPTSAAAIWLIASGPARVTQPPPKPRVPAWAVHRSIQARRVSGSSRDGVLRSAEPDDELAVPQRDQAGLVGEAARQGPGRRDLLAEGFRDGSELVGAHESVRLRRKTIRGDAVPRTMMLRFQIARIEGVSNARNVRVHRKPFAVLFGGYGTCLAEC